MTVTVVVSGIEPIQATNGDPEGQPESTFNR